MSNYSDGYSEGYRVGPYCVQPDGQWAADAYQDDRATGDQPYRDGMRDGRTQRIEDMGDRIYDVNGCNEEAGRAWQAYQSRQGGGDAA